MHVLLQAFSKRLTSTLESGALYTFFCRVWLGIVSFFAVWRLFEKADIQGWKVLIPIYNIYCVSRIVFKKGCLVFVACVGLISVMVLAGAMYMPILPMIVAVPLTLWFDYCLSKRYEHGWGYTLGLFFSLTFFIVLLGWGNEQYVD